MNLNHDIKTCPQHIQHEGFQKAATVIVHHLILIISRITLLKKFSINFTVKYSWNDIINFMISV